MGLCPVGFCPFTEEFRLATQYPTLGTKFQLLNVIQDTVNHKSLIVTSQRDIKISLTHHPDDSIK